jgi:hypothetical protein
LTVAALYVTPDSIYKTMPAVDCYDAQRDARTFPADVPVVAHPPCRLWGKMAMFSTAPASEKDLAIHAVEAVRECGGVLEHPAGSKLWPAAGLPWPGEPADRWGGFTVTTDQRRFGHRAEKQTWLYVAGRGDLPRFPRPAHGVAAFVVGDSRRPDGSYRPEIPKKERLATPPRFAAWLVDVAEGATRPKKLDLFTRA